MKTRIPLVECLNFVGTTPKKFEGEKKYISTGALDKDHINESDVEMVTFENRPSRANLEVSAGDILFAKMASTEKTFVVDAVSAENIYSTGFCAVRADESKILPKSLYYFLSSSLFLDQKDKNSSGATQKAIKNAGLVKISINLPSLDNQQEFISQMDSLHNAIVARREQLAKLDELVKSRFIELFDACNCRVSTFGKEFSFISRGKSPSYVELSDLAVINQACIYWNALNFDKVKYNDVSYSGDRILQFGDVLVNSTGTGTLGRANIFMRRSADKRYMADSHVTIIRGSVSCHPIYIKCYLEQAKIQDAIYRNCVSGSTNQIELSKEKFKELELPVPPMTMQKQFAAFVEQTDKSKLAVQQSLEKLETLKKALMQKYFG